MTDPRVRRALARPGSLPAFPTDDGADDVRRRLRREGFVPLRPDDRIEPFLQPGEAVLDVSRNARLARTCDPGAEGPVGDMYLTTRRLVHLVAPGDEIDLDDIREAVVAGEWLLLDLGGGAGARIRVDQPGVLLVRTAAARAARRQQRRTGAKAWPMPR